MHFACTQEFRALPLSGPVATRGEHFLIAGGAAEADKHLAAKGRGKKYSLCTAKKARKALCTQS